MSGPKSGLLLESIWCLKTRNRQRRQDVTEKLLQTLEMYHCTCVLNATMKHFFVDKIVIGNKNDLLRHYEKIWVEFDPLVTSQAKTDKLKKKKILGYEL